MDNKYFDGKKYDLNAKKILKDNIPFSTSLISDLPEYIAEPYKECFYYLEKNFRNNDLVLEIASGSGFFTKYLLKTQSKVIATDISLNSLRLIESQYPDNKNLKTKVVDMESLPFKDNKFQYIVSVGSLSYGNHNLVKKEIYRCLKKGGKFICIDSLSHNPFYKLNRLFQFIQKKRSFSTIRRMPTIKTIESYSKLFKLEKLSYFGLILFLVPLLKIFISSARINQLSKFVDRKFKWQKFSFKFLLICEK